MLQRCTNPTSIAATATDTNAHAFATQPALFVIFSVPAANTSAVSIGATASISGTSLVAPISIAKGTTLLIPVGPLLNLESLAFQLGTANDTINLLVIG